MFGVEGHEWPIEPYMPGADMISVVEYAGSEVLDVFIRGGAADRIVRLVTSCGRILGCRTRSPDNGAICACCRQAIRGFSPQRKRIGRTSS